MSTIGELGSFLAREAAAATPLAASAPTGAPLAPVPVNGTPSAAFAKADPGGIPIVIPAPAADPVSNGH